MLSNYRDIIKAPIITEKSTSIASNEKTYVFKVSKDANKTQIKLAIEELFGVKRSLMLKLKVLIQLMFILKRKELDVILV